MESDSVSRNPDMRRALRGAVIYRVGLLGGISASRLTGSTAKRVIISTHCHCQHNNNFNETQERR